jgi:general secretion pathway protein F
MRYIRSDEGRKRYDKFVLRLPIFGRLVQMIATTRFASTLSTLLSSGVPMLSALDIVKTVVGNWVFSEVIDSARENVREGESLAHPLRRSGQFDPIVSHMITVGERSGELESMLNHVSNAYESQVDARISQLTSVLEPMILIIMAVVVGFIVLSIMLPIMQLNNAIQG